jgi:3-hydroxybutyryl-CoA dehydrogenase
METRSRSMEQNISVIGAGTMGNGIAHIFAQYDFKVMLIDVNTDQLEKAKAIITKNLDRQVAKQTITEAQKQSTLNNIIFSNDIAAGVKNASLVIEAATENREIKLKIFKQLDDAAPAGCILATNTSSISIAEIASVTKRPELVIGMHFMNPVPVMKLVEVIKGHETRKETADTIVALSKQLDKIPCVVNDYPGFIANRILMPMINEAILALEDGVSGVAEIDTIMKLGMSHPMGPLQLADFIGLDVCLNIMFVLHDGFDNIKYTPAALLINMVAAKTLGVKTGEGFYIYSKDNKELIVSSRFK